MNPRCKLIDDHRSACLGDVGAPDYLAAVCVTADGEDALWLVNRAELDSDRPAYGNPAQPHEKVGRLPGHVRERIWGDALRCGRPRYDGQPCRHRVKEPGDTCRAHSPEAQHHPGRTTEQAALDLSHDREAAP